MPTSLPLVRMGKHQKTAPRKVPLFELSPASGQHGPRSIVPMIIFLLGLVDGMEVKGFVKLPYHTANILMGEATVMHCHNHITTAGVVAPRVRFQSRNGRISFLHKVLLFIKLWGPAGKVALSLDRIAAGSPRVKSAFQIDRTGGWRSSP